MSFALTDASCEAREESENYKMEYSYRQLNSIPLPLVYVTGPLTNCDLETSIVATLNVKITLNVKNFTLRVNN